MQHSSELQQRVKTLCSWATILRLAHENDKEKEAEISLIARQIEIETEQLMLMVAED